MDWRGPTADDDHPPSDLALFGIVCIGSVLFAYAWVIDFLAARWLMWIAWAPAIFFGVTRAHWVMRFVSRGKYSLRDGGRMVGLFCTAVVALFTWFVLVRAVGGGITRLTGSAATLPPMRMTLYYNSKGASCNDQLHGEAVNQFGQGRLCISKAQSGEYRGVPEGMLLAPTHSFVEVQLAGRQGPFGFYITHFNRVPDPAGFRKVSGPNAGRR